MLAHSAGCDAPQQRTQSEASYAHGREADTDDAYPAYDVTPRPMPVTSQNEQSGTHDGVAADDEQPREFGATITRFNRPTQPLWLKLAWNEFGIGWIADAARLQLATHRNSDLRRAVSLHRHRRHQGLVDPLRAFRVPFDTAASGHASSMTPAGTRALIGN